MAEAVSYARAGIKAPKTEAQFELPEELVEAVDADLELAEAFHALTLGRQRSYVIVLNGAKKSKTRIARIANYRERILEGRGANER